MCCASDKWLLGIVAHGQVMRRLMQNGCSPMRSIFVQVAKPFAVARHVCRLTLSLNGRGASELGVVASRPTCEACQTYPPFFLFFVFLFFPLRSETCVSEASQIDNSGLETECSAKAQDPGDTKNKAKGNATTSGMMRANTRVSRRAKK